MTDDRMAVVITKLFARLQGIYGTSFTSKFSTGFNATSNRDDGWENAKSVWASDLAGYVDRIEIIADALKHVDPERAPSSRQFLQLCYDAGRQAELRRTSTALEHKPTAADRERQREMAARLEQSVKKTPDEYDGLMWARKPRSQRAMDEVFDGKKNPRRSPALAEIFDQLVADGICSPDGRLLKIYRDGQWFIHQRTA